MTEMLLKSFVEIVVFGIAAYFIKALIANSSALSVEQYKKDMNLILESHKLTLNSELEKFKAQLVINVNRQGKLYEKRLHVIDEMHKKLRDVEMALVVMFSAKKDEDGKTAAIQEEESIQQAYKTLRDFATSFLYNIHFFKREHARLLEVISTDCVSIYKSYFLFQQLIESRVDTSQPEVIERMNKSSEEAMEKLKRDLPKAIDQLEDEFRKLMGVED